MLKLLKQLKYTKFSVVIIIVLLFVEAMADLALPDYTSKIVNIGIQQSGIEEISPEAIRKSKLEDVILFAGKDGKEITEKYELITKDSSNYAKYQEKYPTLKTEDIYVRKELDKNELNRLGEIMKKPLMIISNLNNDEMAQKFTSQLTTNTKQEDTNLISNMSILDMLRVMPEEQRVKIIDNMNEKIEQMPDSILSSAAIETVKQEYKELGMDVTKLQNNYIFFSGLRMLGVALISMTCGIVLILLSSKVSAYLGKILREKVFTKVLSFSRKEFRNFGVASLITRNTNDIQQIQNLIPLLFRIVFYAPIVGIGGLIKVLTNKSNSMAWIIGLAVGLIICIVLVLFVIAMPKFKKLQELIDKLNGVAREILVGIPVIRAFNTERREEARFDKANKDLMQVNIFVNRAMSFMMPALMLVLNGLTLLIIWNGAKGINDGVMQVGDMMAFIQYAMQIVMSFLMISMISIMLPRASVSANRINEILNTESSIKDCENTKELDVNKKGFVEFRNVSFKYPDADEELLTDITFTAEPGKITAIIGSTGSGKSTIVNLIPRFYDVTAGDLLIDGVNIKDIKLEELRKIIGFVPQKGVLFSGTIESNIKYANDNMSDKDMIEAAKIAQAEEFILSKDDKYKAEISQGGNNVSGGQKQRLSIARAIAKNPEILVFDDSFSALDFKTDVKLRTALLEKNKEKTIIIVAQRISTVLHADQIIVLDDGKIAGIGTHEELIKNNNTYKEIALSQLSKEELE